MASDASSSMRGKARRKSRKESKDVLRQSSQAAGYTLKPVLSEVLMYMDNHRDRATAEMLKKSVLVNFTPDEVADAKKRLICEFVELDGYSATIDRRASNARSAHEAELDDIIEIFDYLDDLDLLDKRVVFVAARWDRVPKYGPEEANLCAVVDRQMRLEATVARLEANYISQTSAQGQGETADDVMGLANSDVSSLKTAVSDLDNKMATLSQNVTAQISQLAAVCQQLAASVSSRIVSAPTYASPPPSRPPPVDRTQNVVVFGLNESRDGRTWREELAKVLQTTAGREVQVADALRLGQFTVERTRPVLVKLQSAWDRRLVLSGARNLMDEPTLRHIYVKPDETVEDRRRAMLKKLYSRALQEGKDVRMSENDGQLFVDDTLFFSVKDGFVESRIINNGGRHV